MTPADWQKYKDIINEWQEDAFQQPITWHSVRTITSVNGEDNNIRHVDIPILGLVQYNFFRAWPITQFTDSGSIDKESCMLYLNTKYLRDNNWTNADGQFIFDTGLDRFTINGLKYIATGESQVAQANNETILNFIILKREEIQTSKKTYQ